MEYDKFLLYYYATRFMGHKQTLYFTSINRWDDTYERVLLGGLTCDSDDYYNSEQHINAIYLPKYKIAIEYHGSHHYNELPSFGMLELYQTRDIEKHKQNPVGQPADGKIC